MNELTLPTALTLEDALRVALLLATASHSRPTPPELVAEARAIHGRIPSASPAWCEQWVATAERAGSEISIDRLADAWHVEAARRIETVPVPYAAWHATSGAWPTWERARRRALIAGVTADQAIAHANTEVGILADDELDVDPEAIRLAKRHGAAMMGDHTHAERRTVTGGNLVGDRRPPKTNDEAADGGAL